MYIPLLVRPQDNNDTAQRLLFQLVRLKLAKQTGETHPSQLSLLEIRRSMLWQFLCLCLQQRHALTEDLAIHFIGQLANQILHNPAQVAQLRQRVSLAEALDQGEQPGVQTQRLAALKAVRVARLSNSPGSAIPPLDNSR
jgi:hypothetical protein